MQLFVYTIVFIMGCFFGSFYTLAVYRIPRKEDILIKHSYCPNCNHKLGFFDLFPVLSYLFLGGKCRYCKNKIRPRYFILEICSGLTFVLIALGQDLLKNVGDIEQIVYLGASSLYVAVLFIIAGIDKENIKVETSVLLFGFLMEIMYIIYLCTLGRYNVYQYVIYLMIAIVLLVMSLISYKLTMKQSYVIQILFLSLYMVIFCGGIEFGLSMILTLLAIAFYTIGKKKKETLPIGFFMSVCNIIVLIGIPIISHYVK